MYSNGVWALTLTHGLFRCLRTCRYRQGTLSLLSVLPYVFGLCPICSRHLTALKLSRQAAACSLQASFIGNWHLRDIASKQGQRLAQIASFRQRLEQGCGRRGQLMTRNLSENGERMRTWLHLDATASVPDLAETGNRLQRWVLAAVQCPELSGEVRSWGSLLWFLLDPYSYSKRH